MPLSIASRKLSAVTTVPAPISISGPSRQIRSIDPAAAAVRNVISTIGRPPSSSALARGNAASTESMVTTGTTPGAADPVDGFSLAHQIVYPCRLRLENSVAISDPSVPAAQLLMCECIFANSHLPNVLVVIVR